jgi:hypothetical protein
MQPVDERIRVHSEILGVADGSTGGHNSSQRVVGGVLVIAPNGTVGSAASPIGYAADGSTECGPASGTGSSSPVGI